MKMFLELNEWEACRLKSLVKDGMMILEAQGRTQKGIDGYTIHDLQGLMKYLNGITSHSPQFANSTKLIQ